MKRNQNILAGKLRKDKERLRKLQNTEFFTLLLFLVMLAGTVSLSPAVSSLMNSAIIRSTGEISITNITASSGSAKDIQAAVDWVAAHVGMGNVHIPEGAFNFVEVGEPWMTVNIPAGVNIFGAPTERDDNDQVVEWKTVLVMPSDVPGNETIGVPAWFKITGTGDPNKPSRFSDIKLVGYRSINPESTSMHIAISVDTVIDFRIDHCYLEHTTAGIDCSSGYQKLAKIRGVIDHCYLVNTYGVPDPYENRTIGYGVHVLLDWHENVWEPIDEVLGHYNDYTVFIEDCYFEKWRHCVCANNGGHYVFRHNTIQYDFGFGSLDLHEKRTETSARAAEIYENQFLYPSSRYGKIAIKWRGGSGVAFNNTVVGYSTFAYLFEYDQGMYNPNDIWVWGNTLNGCTDIVVSGSNIKEGQNYYRYAPHTFSYSPYPYPHPLTLKP